MKDNSSLNEPLPNEVISYEETSLECENHSYDMNDDESSFNQIEKELSPFDLGKASRILEMDYDTFFD